MVTLINSNGKFDRIKIIRTHQTFQSSARLAGHDIARLKFSRDTGPLSLSARRCMKEWVQLTEQLSWYRHTVCIYVCVCICITFI
jgi:hypothetical protein